MNITLTRLTSEVCLAYLDDVIIFSENWPNHLQHLQQVVFCLRQARLKQNPSKCTLGCTMVSFLGHMVSAQGIQPDPCLLSAVWEIAPPSPLM